MVVSFSAVSIFLSWGAICLLDFRPWRNAVFLGDLRDTIRNSRCAIGPTARDGHPCDDVRTYFVHLSLAEIADPAERQRLQSIPTGLSLAPENMQLLEAAGQKLVLTSPEMIAFRNSLNGSVALTQVAPPAGAEVTSPAP
jgi:hypothetical protein